MNQRILATALAAIVVSAAVPALAQENKPVGLSLRGGVFLPTNSVTRDSTGNMWVGFGADYKVLSLKSNSNTNVADLSLSFDYFGKGSLRHVPLLLNYQVSSGHIFYEAGGGIGFAKVPNGDVFDDRVRFAYQAGVGFNFSNSSTTPVFVEAKYIGSARSELNGFGLYLGVRL